MPIRHAATRIDIGGKLLTNLLNEIISYKDYNLQGETMLVNDIKEQLCYVSQDFDTDMERVRSKEFDILKQYVLPDYNHTSKGYSRDFDPANNQDEQAITMGYPRFSVPEALFNPSDIGILQAGIPEMISQCIQKCPEAMEGLLYRNIILTGGNTNYENFAERCENELVGTPTSTSTSGFKPNDTEHRLFLAPNPELNTWEGLKMFANRPDFEDYVVEKAEYEEEGARVFRKFNL